MVANPGGTVPGLRGRALMWLAQREHSRQELAQKLARWARRVEQGLSGDSAGEPREAGALRREIESLLDSLEVGGYLSDARFVESRVNARLLRFGNRRIEQELRRYGAELGPPLRAQLQLSEVARARRVWAVKFGSPAADASGRSRQMRFLAGRGFSAAAIRQVLSGDDDEPCEDDV